MRCYSLPSSLSRDVPEKADSAVDLCELEQPSRSPGTEATPTDAGVTRSLLSLLENGSGGDQRLCSKGVHWGVGAGPSSLALTADTS